VENAESIVTGWQQAARVADRHESWLRRRAHLLNGAKNAEGIWEFPREALERLRPAAGEAVEPDIDTSAADDTDDDIIRIHSGTAQPADVEVVAIRSAPPAPAATTPAAPHVPSAAAEPAAKVDSNGLTGPTFRTSQK
jgi:hypothetical protein